jgi:hypothetical protein
MGKTMLPYICQQLGPSIRMSSQKAASGSANKVADQAGGSQFELKSVFLLGILLCDASCNPVEFALRLGKGDPVFDACDWKDNLIAAVLEPVDAFERRLVRHGNEEIGLEEFLSPLEAFRVTPTMV